MKYITILILVLKILKDVDAKSTYGNPYYYRPYKDALSPKRNESLKYEEGKTYVYNFDSQIITQIVGTSTENQTLTISGTMNLIVTNKSSSDMMITIYNVEIQGSSNQKLNPAELHGSSMRFSYKERSVDDIYLEPSDPSWSSNFKRSLVSLFVNSEMGYDTHEVSTFPGICHTKYDKNGSIYTKFRDLNQCQTNDKGGFVQLGKPEDFPYTYTYYFVNKDAYILNSTQTCVQNFTSDLLQSVKCTELHKLKPFSTRDNGAQTKIETSLTLIKIQNQPPDLNKFDTLTNRVDLKFDYSNSGPNFDHNPHDDLAHIITSLCDILKDGSQVNSTSLSLLSELKRSMRTAKEEDLFLLAQYLEGSKKFCTSFKNELWKFFMDAAITSATGETIKFLIKLYYFQIPPEHIGQFTLHSVFSAYIDTDTMRVLTKMISNKSVHPQLLLAASGIAYKFNSSESNRTNEVYTELVDTISKYIEEIDEEDKNSLQLGITALQALGNLKHLTPKAISVIEKSLKKSRRIRVNAFQAFRRDPCQDTLRNASRDIFENLNESSDVRIQAYLAFIECAYIKREGYQYEDYIREKMAVEPSKQVSTFVYSHCKNYNTAYFYNGEDNIPQNGLKFSKNYFYKGQDLSGNDVYYARGNVIYSADSYLPRTMGAKFSFKLEGSLTYHLAEVGINLDGFDRIFESYFGPKSELRKLISNRKTLTRQKRDKIGEIADDLDNLISQIQDKPKTSSSGPVVDEHLRIFGTTIRVDFYDTEKIIKNIQEIFTNSNKSLISVLQEQMLKEFEWEHLMPSLEYEVVVPTISGFPLRLNVGATNFKSLKSEMKDKEMTLRGIVSGNLKGSMALMGGPVKSGLEVDLDVNFSPAILTKWTTDENGTHSYKLGIPTTGKQGAEVRTNVYWMEHLGEYPRRLIKVSEHKTTNEIREFCSKSMSKYIGLDICSKVKTGASGKSVPRFPLNGENILSFQIVKSSPGAAGFFVELKAHPLEGTFPNVSGFASITVDTPGHTKNLKTDLNLVVFSRQYEVNSTREMIFDLVSSSWWKDFEFHAKSVESPTKQNFEILVRNKGEEHGLKGQKVLKETISEESEKGSFKRKSFLNEYELSLISPSGKSNLMSGDSMSYFDVDESENEIEGSTASGNVNLMADIPLLYTQGNFSGKWEKATDGNGELTLTISDVKGFSKRFDNVLLNGFAKISSDFKRSFLRLDAMHGKNLEHNLTVRNNYDFKSVQTPSIKINIESTNIPSLNFKGSLDGDFQNNSKMTTFYLSHKSSDFLVSFHSSHKESGVIGREFKDTLDVSLPCFGQKWHASLGGKIPDRNKTDEEFMLNMLVKSKKGIKREISFDGRASLNNFTLDLKAQVLCGTKTANYSTEFKPINDTEWSLEMNGFFEATPNNSYQYNLSTKLGGNLRRSGYLVSILTSNRMTKPIKIDTGYQYHGLDPDRYIDDIFSQAYFRLLRGEDILGQFSAKSDFNKYLLFYYEVPSYIRENLEIYKTKPGNNKHIYDIKYNGDCLWTGRRVDSNITLELGGKVDNTTTYCLVGVLAWDASRNPNQTLEFNVTYVHEDSLWDYSMISEQIKLFGREVKFTTKRNRSTISFPLQSRWMTGFEWEYLSKEKNMYFIGFEPTDGNVSTLNGKLNLKSQLAGQELLQLPLEIRYGRVKETNPTVEPEEPYPVASSYDNYVEYDNSIYIGYDFNIEYKPILDSSGYPPFNVNVRTRKENDTTRTTAWVNQTGDVLFELTHTRYETLIEETYLRSKVEMWIGGINETYKETSGRENGNYYERLFKASDSPRKYSEVYVQTTRENSSYMASVSRNEHDLDGVHRWQYMVAGFNNSRLGYLHFMWDNPLIQSYLETNRIHLQGYKRDVNKYFSKIWNELSEIENSKKLIFDSKGSGKILDPKTEAQIGNQDSFRLVEVGFQILNGIFDGYGSFYQYLTDLTPSNSSSVGMTEYANKGYQKFETSLTHYMKIKSDFMRMYNNFIGRLEESFIGTTSLALGRFLTGNFWHNDYLEKYENDYNQYWNDLLLALPYNETDEFRDSFEKYVSQNNSIKNESDSVELKEVVKKLGKLIDKGWAEYYKADYMKGVITMQVPVFLGIRVVPFTSWWAYPFSSWWAYPVWGRRIDKFWSKYFKYSLPNIPSRVEGLLPPADAYAVIIGSQFITFDGKLGYFNSECEYLLAAEFVNKNFSITVRMGKGKSEHEPTIRNIILKTKNETTHLDRDTNLVTQNGKPLEPVGPNSQKLDKDVNGTSWTMIKADGIEISCTVSRHPDICIVKMSGFYHGNVKGLLGTFNNEPADDFTLPSGKVAESNDTFSNGWKLDSKCKDSKIVTSDEEYNTYECEDITRSSSPFQPCFTTIDAFNYQDMCRLLMSRKVNSTNTLCAAATAYKKVCEFANIDVKSLIECPSNFQ